MTEGRTPKQAPGPFYVAKDECIACRAPEVEARGLMSFDDDRTSCFFERQPMTPEEEYRAIRRLQLRYRAAAVNATVVERSAGEIGLKLSAPQRAVTPGQSGVMYRGERVIGGGRIR